MLNKTKSIIPVYLVLFLSIVSASCFVKPVLAASESLGREPIIFSEFIEAQLAGKNGLSGAQLLEKGEESLLARAWLTGHAEKTIDVQYFIWSTDNTGILAAEFLLRAAQRGVRVRVIVDDLLIDAPDSSMLALAAHPNIEIKIYNPQHSVGVSKPRRLYNMLADFRSFNQRMHDKAMIVDQSVAITGGRNMADEYFDYNQEYNFRDRDIFLIMPDGGLEFFAQLVARGVEVRIITNSLAATDNLQAFSGYMKQRKKILKAGIKVYEFKPQPMVRKNLIDRLMALEKSIPIFAIHAKSMVVDGKVLFVGTFNLDSRSANLNTEVGC